MSEELEVLKLVTERLEQCGLKYFISGSMAANYYTVPRMTRDIDIIIELQQPLVRPFVEKFENDFYVEEAAIQEEVNRRGMFNLIHKEYAFKVDFIIRKETEFQTASFKRRRKVNFGNCSVWIISLEDLIISKLLWGRDSLSELQLKDVKNLLHSQGNLDNTYLEQWINQLFLRDIYEKAKQ